ncbi:small-conductance mechanosensitive channel [Microbacterium terrae]|uniref:Small-conductance mechanosensitive channel n=1 Tax=Microbacterium terrae TaxID=69369 RepID=A0A0M2HLF2_9MICO|nr:mechanosensitive ion channel domain-containing protein [Microbacterium terrae]KJL45725.1 Small-conductance mechanosensitive channel [Microbacterium terrae]MBP1077873.1 small-conductance mechanosensitive channel [Microbacterium terrae]GLK00044.1 hypothetical protein GCM10017594_32410 [Microbacterium terrae]
MDFSQFFTGTITWWDAALALIALIAGWIGSRIAKRTALRLMRRVPGTTPAAAQVVARAAQYTLLLLGFGIALAFLGANVQPLLAIFLVVGVVAVLVLRGVADNFAAGVLIQTRKPVEVGEEVMVEGIDGERLSGTVTDLNSRSVVVTTFDGRVAHVPNSAFLGSTVMNHTRHGMRRAEVQVRWERTEVLVDTVTDAVTDAVRAVGPVLAEPAPQLLFVAVSPERVRARVQFWFDPTDAVSASSAVVRAIGDLFDERGWQGAVSTDTSQPLVVGPGAV